MTESVIDSGLWVRGFHPADTGAVRLVCFPHAGGSASFFFPVSRALSPALEVLAVQYPGRQDRRTEICIDNIPELADQVYEALRPFADRPLAFFGHSMGATVAFEVAARFERDGGPALAALIVSGRRAPSRTRVENVHRRDDAGVLEELRKLGGTDTEIFDDEEVVRMILPALRADYQAVETYRYQAGPKLSCPISAFVGDRDPRVTLDEAAAWSEHTTGGFDSQIFDGGHFYLIKHQADVVEAVASRVASGSRS
jgi:surfactin synthase thioesterase subunit